MLKNTAIKTGTTKQSLVKVTFALASDDVAQPVSVLVNASVVVVAKVVSLVVRSSSTV